ncbi:hypothetical protein TNCV_3221 [Trichonephila clavipes]|nr:hypothetical protein TNCV_3221 [Trichonephila clavipes]
MSQRRRLPNSLRWRAVGWMEMGLSQADAAVSMCHVVLFSDFGINTNLRFCFFCRRPFSKKKNHYCAAARCRPLSSIRKKNLTTVRNRLHNAGLYAYLTDDSEGNGAREHVSWTAMDFVHRRVQIYNGE